MMRMMSSSSRKQKQVWGFERYVYVHGLSGHQDIENEKRNKKIMRRSGEKRRKDG